MMHKKAPRLLEGRLDVRFKLPMWAKMIQQVEASTDPEDLGSSWCIYRDQKSSYICIAN